MFKKITRNSFFTNSKMIIRINFNYYESISGLMSQESEEKLAKIENKIQKQLVETIKTSRQEYGFKQSSIGSASSKIQDNTLEIIQKIDSKIPSYVKLYSDLYKKYLHIMSNVCNAAYLGQRDFYSKMGVNDAIFTMFDTYLESVQKMYLLQMDLRENMTTSYVNHRLTVLEFYDQMIERNISSFAKIFSMFDNFNK